MDAEKTASLRKMNILVIDDESTTVKLYMKLLGDMGHKAVVAKNGEDAIEKAGQKCFDCVILDLVLPDIQGMEVLKQIKENLMGAPVVIVTGNPSFESSVEAIKTGGVYDYITKPFDNEEFSMVIRRAIEKAVLMNENKRLMNRLEATNKALTERVNELEEFSHKAVSYEEEIIKLKKEMKHRGISKP